MSSRVWTVLDLLRSTTEHLAKKGVSDARLNAELLLANVLGLKRLDLYLQFDRPVEEEKIAEFRGRVLRRARREPLQYIAGNVDFREIRLAVDPRVLIPRPETELLVGEVLRWAGVREDLSAVDIGTGSGAIALSLAAEGRFVRIVATDLSPDALEVAVLNRAAVDAPVEVELRLGGAYVPLGGERFDVVVSNPPYVGLQERASLEPEVSEWEPELALFSGDGGLDLIGELVRSAPDHLRRGGLLALEIGAGQRQRVQGLVRETGRFSEPVVRRDLAGRDRIVLAELRD